MAEIVNLRRVRKAKARADDATVADANRIRHGRSKAERAAAEAIRATGQRVLDGLKLERDGEAGE